MTRISRRTFLSGCAAVACAGSLPARPTLAQPGSAPLILRAARRTIEIGGRSASVMGLVDAKGNLGLTLDPGRRFHVEFGNDLDVETIAHWHGQIPPNARDGISNTNPMLKPGVRRTFDFAPRPGTYWMHSHIPAQEIDLLAAPLIVRSQADIRADRQ